MRNSPSDPVREISNMLDIFLPREANSSSFAENLAKSDSVISNKIAWPTHVNSELRVQDGVR